MVSSMKQQKVCKRKESGSRKPPFRQSPTWMNINVLQPLLEAGERRGVGSDGVVMFLLADINTERKDKVLTNVGIVSLALPLKLNHVSNFNIVSN